MSLQIFQAPTDKASALDAFAAVDHAREIAELARRDHSLDNLRNCVEAMEHLFLILPEDALDTCVNYSCFVNSLWWTVAQHRY